MSCLLCLPPPPCRLQGSQKELLNLTQQDYVNRIEELNQSLQDAWASDQKVKALKIVIQVRPSDLLCVLVSFSFRVSWVKLLSEERGFSEACLQVSPGSSHLFCRRVLLWEAVMVDLVFTRWLIPGPPRAAAELMMPPGFCSSRFLGWPLTHLRLVQTKDRPTVWVSLTRFPLSLRNQWLCVPDKCILQSYPA